MRAWAMAGTVFAAMSLTSAPVFAQEETATPIVCPPNRCPPGSVIEPGAAVERLATGFQFTEGPAADASGDIFFSDVRASRIHLWSVAAGVLSTHRDGAVGTNGLYFDGRYRLVVCESGARRIVREEVDGTITVLADAYDGKRLNSPNDVWIHPAGHIYFTDPRYGSAADVEQDGMHVYVLPGDGGPIRRVTSDLRQPNGVIGTPDGDTLYVTDPGGGANKTWRYRVLPDGSLVDKIEFAAVGGDGMAIDERGNVYLAKGGSVLVFASNGAPQESIGVPGSVTNVAFGGSDFRTLFMTASGGLYAVRMAYRGADGPYAWATPTPGTPSTPTPDATATMSPEPPTSTPTTATTPTTPTTQSTPTTPMPTPMASLHRLYLPFAVRLGPPGLISPPPHTH